ncbi:MAG: TonB-dependent receptor [Fidelibacterota bacterium]
MNRVVLGIFALLIGGSSRLSAATISGKVLCHLEKTAIADALVILIKTDDEDFARTSVSDAGGNFIFLDVLPGKYNIEVVRDGYFKNVLFDLLVESGRDCRVTIRLLRRSRDDQNEYCFMLGGIEVPGDSKAIIPEEMVTTRKIGSGEIEHMQATNLGDILTLVPGVEKSRNPGLSKMSYVGLRSIAIGGRTVDVPESFGTGIVVDGNEFSSDATVGTESIYGLDLRVLPADNIKSVEVVTGIPSVEYSNISNGVVRVETKSGVMAPQLKFKFNPDTKEFSFLHGFRAGKGIFDYHFNWARGENNLRLDRDALDRYNVKGTYSRKFCHDRIETKISSNFIQMMQNQEPEDEKRIQNFVRDYYLNNSFQIDIQRSHQVRYAGQIDVNVNHKQNHAEKWVNDNVYVYKDSTFTREIDGQTITYDSTIIDVKNSHYGFVGEKDVIGKEWKIAGQLQRWQTINSANTDHRILAGLLYRHDFNTGAGVVLDSVFNYYGTASMRRSYRFDRYPHLKTLSLYLQDDIRGVLWKHRYDMMVGLRYDSFNPTGLTTAQHGVFLNPRFNFRFFFSNAVRLRFGVGRTAKTVSLGNIYDPPTYITHVVDGKVVQEVQEEYNPELQSYATAKYELSLDWKPADMIGMSITGYVNRSDDQIRSVSYPWGYYVNPDTITRKSFSLNHNVGTYRSSGVEWTIHTGRIGNVQLRTNLTYRFTKSGRRGLEYDSSPDTTWEDIWYPLFTIWKEKVIVDMQINYVSKRLGIWLTVDAQYIPLEHCRREYRSNSTILFDNTIKEFVVWYQGMDHWYNYLMEDYSGYWLFNFRLTKSLSASSEISLYINNLFDDRAMILEYDDCWRERNPELYFGMEVSWQW